MTVFFDDPFWVAVLETPDGATVRATRVVLGAEPTDAELYQLLLRHGTALLAAADSAPAVHSADRARVTATNPKRLARQAARLARDPRPSTAAQEAVKRAHAAQAKESAQAKRERRAEHAEHRREVRRARSRARHRGH